MKTTLRKSRKNRIRLISGISLIILFAISLVVLVSGREILHRGEMVPGEGYELYVRDYGEGDPPVIIEAGLNCRVDMYYDLQTRLSDIRRVIAYDHAGISQSTPSNNPRTLPYYVSELRDMLQYKKISPPYVLLGHSLGGHIVRYYAWKYPEEVSGIILIEAPPEDWLNYIRENWDPDVAKKYFRFWDTKLNINNYKGVGLTELGEYEANNDSVRGKEIPPDIPVLMFTGKNSPHFRKDSIGQAKDMEAWISMQKDMIRNVADAKQIVLYDAGHWLQNDKPDLVEREIKAFLLRINKQN